MPIWKLTSLEVSKFAVTLKIRWFWIMSIWTSISLRLCQFARMSVQKLYHIESLSIWKSIRLKVCQLTRILVKNLLVWNFVGLKFCGFESLLVWKFFGLKVCWFDSLLICKFVVWKFVGLKVCWFESLLLFKYAILHVCLLLFGVLV